MSIRDIIKISETKTDIEELVFLAENSKRMSNNTRNKIRQAAKRRLAELEKKSP